MSGLGWPNMVHVCACGAPPTNPSPFIFPQTQVCALIMQMWRQSPTLDVDTVIILMFGLQNSNLVLVQELLSKSPWSHSAGPSSLVPQQAALDFPRMEHALLCLPRKGCTSPAGGGAGRSRLLLPLEAHSGMGIIRHAPTARSRLVFSPLLLPTS